MKMHQYDMSAKVCLTLKRTLVHESLVLCPYDIDTEDIMMLDWAGTAKIYAIEEILDHFNFSFEPKVMIFVGIDGPVYCEHKTS